ncbi:dipeptidyl aminopeptidase [Grosmannia clavigera kw1407]|uniref:Dipeptidase n=1 Tax=Grosmannia clavigera (strain kw1407 / UAMH 11150) TaxID=655863 RepID=F0XBH9_GROCL|nr:dipeptidyl aminopeptidase [Grosmannia clavigera kw1407]EFX05015.1 dipeptidyl aminopeptidase [Grosmannia clavigera kw1407]
MSDDPPAPLVNERPSANLAKQVNAPQSTPDTQIVRLQQKKPTRALSLRTAALFVSASIALAAKWSYGAPETFDPSDFKARTEHILSTTPLIDGHNDLPYLFRLQLDNKIYDQEFSFQTGLGSHTDLKRMREGRVGGQFWSTFIDCPDIVHMDDPNHAVRDTLEQIDVAKRLIAEVPDLEFCDNSKCARRAFKQGKIPSMLGAEGLHQVGSALAVIRQFHSLGLRYITLTHNCDNAFATAATTVTETGKDSGLSEFGVEAIKEMNRLGIMVDLAHVSHRTMLEALDVTRAPVILSHTGCHALAKSNRNVPDSVLRRLPSNGGVAMIYFVRKFIKPDDPDKASVDDVVDHILHVVKVAGWDHVGIGGDFDGTGYVVHGLEDVSKYPRLIEALLRRGATDEQVKKLAGENILRVWRQNEIVSETMKKAMKPVEAVWEGRQPSASFEGSALLPRLKPHY